MTTSSMQTVILKVGLHCDGCEKRVKKALWHMKGITSVDVDSKHERVTVTGFVDPSKVLKAVKKTGKPAEIWKYQSGNKNLYGSQPIATTPTKFSTADNRGSTPTKFPTPDSRGTKANSNSNSNSNNNNNKHVQFQSNSKYSSQDRSHHPQPDYLTDGDSDYASSPKPQRRFDNNDTPKSQFYKEHKSSSDYSGQKSSFKDQKSSYKDQKSRSDHSDHKSNNRSHFGSDDENDFSYGNRQSSLHSGYDSDKASSPHSSFKNQKAASHKSSPYTGYDSDKASSPHSSFKNQKANHKSSPYTGYENHKSSSYSDYNEYSKSPYSASAYTNNEHKSHSSNQKKPNKFVSFDDDVYEQKYRPQSEGKHRNQDHGSEQKFYRTYGQEQNYYPSYSYAYHEPSYRVPPANSGFTTMFSEENPNACSIM